MLLACCEKCSITSHNGIHPAVNGRREESKENQTDNVGKELKKVFVHISYEGFASKQTRASTFLFWEDVRCMLCVHGRVSSVAFLFVVC